MPEEQKEALESIQGSEVSSKSLASEGGLIPSEILSKPIGEFGNFDIGFDGQAAKAELVGDFQKKFLKEFVSVKLQVSGAAQIEVKALVDFILETIKTSIKGPVDDIVIEAARPEIYKALGLK